MMSETYLFEVPIYRCPQDNFYCAYAKAFKTRLKEMWGDAVNWTPSGERLADEDQYFRRLYGAPWRYNQIVGWIRIYTFGSQFRGELWFVSRKRLVRRPTHQQMVQRGKAFELTIFPKDDSSEIAPRIRQAMLDCAKELRKKPLVLDLECFDNIARHIDWRACIYPQ